MKRFIRLSLILGLGFIQGPVYAVQAPKVIALEGRLTDNSGNPIITVTAVEFRIFWGGSATTANSGTLKYNELATITPAADGIYKHLLGSGTPLDGVPLTIGTFDTSEDVYLQLSIAGQALLPRLRFGAMPFSFHSETPTGMIAMFATNCPSGWTRFTGLDGAFPRGAAAGQPGGNTGGSISHTHGNGSTGPVNSGMRGDGKLGGGDEEPGGAHTHSIAGANHLPPYREVVFCQKN